jgi:DNA-binding NtrC family response regulator
VTHSRRALVAVASPSLRRAVASALLAERLEVDTADRLGAVRLPSSRGVTCVVSDDLDGLGALVLSPPRALAGAGVVVLPQPHELAAAAELMKRLPPPRRAACVPIAFAEGPLLVAAARSVLPEPAAAPGPSAFGLSGDPIEARVLGATSPVRALRRAAHELARASEPALLVGDAGTGKKLLAEAIARASPRSGPLLVCGADLLEPERQVDELLRANGGGLVGYCAEGTLVVSEVLALVPEAQRLLREHLVDFAAGRARHHTRILATSRGDVLRAVGQGAFDRELYLRLASRTLLVPPLSARRDDVPLLATSFAQRAAERAQKPLARVGEGVLRALRGRRYPGNVAELEALVERAVAVAHGPVLLPKHLALAEGLGPLRLPGAALGDLVARSPLVGRAARAAQALDEPLADASLALADTTVFEEAYVPAREKVLLAFELAYVRSALARAQGNVAEAAREAGMDRANFRRLARRSLARAESQPAASSPTARAARGRDGSESESSDDSSRG